VHDQLILRFFVGRRERDASRFLLRIERRRQTFV
jgi:hypothetical protein